MPFTSTRFSGMRGMTPEANPTVTNRPPRRSERSAGSDSSPPTGSIDRVGAVGQGLAQRIAQRRRLGG